LLQEGQDDIDLPNCYFFKKNWQWSEKIIQNWQKQHFDVHFIYWWYLLVTIPSHLLTTCKIKITD
jgi:hypothetical protein